MIGVKKIIVVLDVRARRRRGTDAERKRTSSVIGPCRSDVSQNNALVK